MDRLERVEFNMLLETSSESDEDYAPRRVVKARNNLLEELDDLAFKRRFRISKNTFQRLVHLLDGVLEPINHRNQPISKVNQILICLRFYASGSFQINIGDHFCVSQPTVSRIVTTVTTQIAALRPQFIRMPDTHEETRKTVLQFFNIDGLPGILGAVDCTHIKIQSSGENNAEVYRNRKNYFSINCQVVGNSNLKILDIVARWPGSVHDTTIFNDSTLRARFENHEFTPYCLVGDGGYPCRTYLLTPVLEPRTPPQVRYNNAQTRTRNPIERLFGVWKRRFPCLSLGMRIKVETICEVIVACAVLHNICCEENDDTVLPDEPDEIEELVIPQYTRVTHQNQNFSTRESIIETVFTNV